MPSQKIADFHSEYKWLSNFHVGTHPIMMRDYNSHAVRFYKTVEHAYQAAKTVDHDERAFVAAAVTPGTAKRRGRQVTLRPDWDSVKLTVMEDLLHQKFSNKILKQQLISTGSAELIEGNRWGDRFWGVDGTGENHLGRLLMQIRNEYIEDLKTTPKEATESHPDSYVDVNGSDGEAPSLSSV